MNSNAPQSLQPAIAAAEDRLTHRSVVYPWHCDHMGHMNVTWYVGKFDEATWQLLGSIGITPSYMRRQKRITAAVDQRVTYRRELHAGDLISIRSARLEVGRSSLRFVHEMVHEETGDLVAAMILTGVHLNLETRRACPLPEALVRAAQARLVPHPAWWNDWRPARSWLLESAGR